jgi:hypothetical protein
VKKEFHILNVPYAREVFFALTKELSIDLGLPQTP